MSMTYRQDYCAVIDSNQSHWDHEGMKSPDSAYKQLSSLKENHEMD